MSLKLSWLGRAGTLARRIGVWGARVWLPVALFAIVALLVSLWWLGPGWTWKGQAPLAPLPMRLALSLVLVVVPLTIWGAVMRFRYHRLRDEQLRQLASQQDPLQAAEDAQQRSLDGSLQLLRCNLRRRNYLYALPWYVVIGQEGSGKTSFINRSSQSFSLSGVDRAAAERSTADSPALAIDWWISNDAVVIDPAGELICQKQYRSVGAAAARLRRQAGTGSCLHAGTSGRRTAVVATLCCLAWKESAETAPQRGDPDGRPVFAAGAAAQRPQSAGPADTQSPARTDGGTGYPSSRLHRAQQVRHGPRL